MRGFDRDLIRGGHYGQRSCEPRKKAEHMAAPTKPAIVKKALANAEPSTHGTKPTCADVRLLVRYQVKSGQQMLGTSFSANDPKRTLGPVC
jgi:hypothetical protein